VDIPANIGGSDAEEAFAVKVRNETRFCSSAIIKTRKNGSAYVSARIEKTIAVYGKLAFVNHHDSEDFAFTSFKRRVSGQKNKREVGWIGLRALDQFGRVTLGSQIFVNYGNALLQHS
jgi:hypothetical protein